MFGRAGRQRTADVIAQLVLPSILILALLFPALWLVKSSTARQHRAEQKTAEQFQRAYDSIDQECAGTRAPVVCEYEVIDASRDYERGEYDLAAQENMAQYALLGLGIAAFGAAVTSAATFFVYRTLEATRDAVTQANGATEAARQAVAVTRETGRDQSRAYVHMKSIRWAEAADRVLVTLIVENSGETPCPRFEVGAIVNKVTAGLPGREYPPIDVDLTGWSALPGRQEFTIPIVPAFGDSEQRVLARDITKEIILVQGSIRYSTIYGELYESEFSFMGKGRSRKTDDEPHGKRMSRTPAPLKVFHRLA